MALDRYVGKNVLITGASSGIGKGIALRLAEEGADLAIHDFDEKGAEVTAEEIRERFGRKVKVYQVDVSNREQALAAMAKTIEDFTQIHVLVCNAGINAYKDIFEFSDEDWDRIIGVNLTGTWNYCRHIGEHMAQKGGGAIVNITSNGAFNSCHMRAPYMASKGGSGMLTKALAQDMADYNIRVNAVAPGTIRTGMTRPTEKRSGYCSPEIVALTTALHRFGEPEELAAAVAFMGADEASYITGATIVCDGGFSIGSVLGLNIRPIPQEGYEDQVPWLDEFDYVQEYKEFKKNK